MSVSEVIKNVFFEFFDKYPRDHESIESLGGDSLDTVEIVMAIEEALDISIEDEFVEEKFWKLPIKQLIDELQVQFNLN